MRIHLLLLGLLLVVLVLPPNAAADIIPIGQSSYCFEISNLADYPDYTIGDISR